MQEGCKVLPGYAYRRKLITGKAHPEDKAALNPGRHGLPPIRQPDKLRKGVGRQLKPMLGIDSHPSCTSQGAFAPDSGNRVGDPSVTILC
jgi:hypothetical protein